MGKTAAQFADKIIITMDNPRDEDPGTNSRSDHRWNCVHGR